jgi:hypothetical protein
LVDILDGLVKLIRARAEEKSISLTLITADLPLINTYGESMEEVFSNLITNAIKYTPEGDSITLTGEVSRDFIHIDISDTGYGILHDELPLIFERFYRVKNDRTKNIMGTGLYLPIVESIVEAHNDTIKAENKECVGFSPFQCASLFAELSTTLMAYSGSPYDPPQRQCTPHLRIMPDKNMPSLQGDHHIRCLDHRRHFLPLGEAQFLRRSLCDNRYKLTVTGQFDGNL